MHCPPESTYLTTTPPPLPLNPSPSPSPSPHQMHPTAAPSPPSEPPPGPSQTLDLINNILSVLLVSCLSVQSFIGKFQVLHSKLTSLKSFLSEISESPHWSDNSLLQTLLPNLLSTLRRIRSLADSCYDPSFSGGKLLMQSDLDMATASLSRYLHDVDLLLRSGVLRQSCAIVLSHPGPGSAKEELIYYIRDLFARLQIGGVEFKEKALESLIQLISDNEKAAILSTKEGNVSYLIQLLDFGTHPVIRELAVTVISMLASANDQSRKAVFEEGGLGPLLKILDTGTLSLKEKAAMAIEAITADPDNAWAVSAYGGVSILIDACRCGSLQLQAHATSAIRNVSIAEDVRNVLAEENALPVLIQLLVSGSTTTQERAANCLSILASSSEYMCAVIIQEKGLQRLVQLLHDSSSFDTLEHVLRAIQSLSSSDAVSKTLSSSTSFIIELADLIIHGNITLQQISAALLTSLSISDGNKRAIASCMPNLVKLMEMPKPGGIQEVASQALVSLLTVRSNRKDLVRDEKSLMRLIQMLDVKNEVVCKEYPVAVVAALSGGAGNGCRKRLVAAGACPVVQRLAEIDIAGAKKAMQRLSGNRLKSIFSRTWRE